MVNVKKETKGSILVVRIMGSIEETVNFDQLLGAPHPEMEINCKEIPRINSVGVKAWIKYFQSCQAKGSKIRFVECSTAIVEQINLISNFTCGGKVESITIPFFCTHCKEQSTSIYTIEQLTALAKTEQLTALDKTDLFKDVKCTRCQCGLTFDDNFDTYLAAFFTK